MAFCSNCGSQIGEEDSSCGKCGARLVPVVPQPVVSPTVGTSRLAITALVPGILGFLAAGASIGVIICGTLGIKETRVGKKRGRGLAIAGLVLGCVVAGVW